MSVFGDLQSLRDRPIGEQGPARAARKGFRARIAIARDNQLFGEAVVDARDTGLAGENFYASHRNGCGARWPASWRGRMRVQPKPAWSCSCSMRGGRAKCRPIFTMCGCRTSFSAAILLCKARH
jgi:hypothetical protein